MRYFVLIIFCLSYSLFFTFPRKRAHVAAVASLFLAIPGVLTAQFTLAQIVRAINWNVMGIFIGTLFLAELFIYSRAPAVLAEHMVNRTRHVGTALLFICILSSVISAFVENVATVLIVAPIALAICKKVNIKPIHAIIGIAISSNLQGTATLIGDPPSMLLAGYAKMNFNDFFIYKGKPGIFFAVQIGAVFSFLILWLFFRRNRLSIMLKKAEKVKVWTPVLLLILMVVLLALSSFVDPEFNYFAGFICMGLGLAGFFWYKLSQKKGARKFLKTLDWETGIFLIGIFILVGALSEFGWLDSVALGLSRIIGKSALLAFGAIVAGSVMISAVVDNVPYLAAMIPVAQKLADDLTVLHGAAPEVKILLLFGLLIGSCLGGNITPIGASANIVGMGILKKQGFHINFWDFIKIGLPFTLAAVIPGALFIWLIWS